MIQTAFRVGFVAALVLSFVVALSTPVHTGIVHGDKWLHLIAYLGLGLLGFLAWPKHSLTVCMVLLAHGALVEVAQSMTTHRMGDIWDWLADAAGVLLALLIYRHILRPITRRWTTD